MSGTKDKSKAKTRVVRDKTVVRPGAGLEAVWPEAGKSAAPSDDPTPAETTEISEPDLKAEEPETSSDTPIKSQAIKSDETTNSEQETAVKADAEEPHSEMIWPDPADGPTAFPEEAQSDAEGETAPPEVKTGPAPENAEAASSPAMQSQAVTQDASSADTPTVDENASQPDETTEEDPAPAEPELIETPPASEMIQDDEDQPPPEAPRIEVPVQQQYASLLSALGDRIQQHPGGHDLLAVLRMLEGQTAPGAASKGMDPKKADEPAPPRIGKSRRTMEDIVRFGQDPSSEFATSTIERATRDPDGGLVLLERFLGLLGPHGALPSAYTDEAIMRGLRGDDSFPRFLDLFNNRFIQLFFRAWADARPIVQHDRPDDDRFLAYLGSAIGIGSPIFRDLDRIDDRLKLLYAGLMSPKTKSPARLKALITGVFGVKVEIDQCVGTWLHLDKDDQLRLGSFGPGGAGALGFDTIVGAKVYSVSDKIRIRIFTRSLDEYRKFLPPTRTRPNPWTEKLFDLIDFYLGLEIEYEIELALPKRCASSVEMNRNNSATLGHIGWLKPATQEEDTPPPPDGEDEEMLTDTRFRPVRRHTAVYQ
ncbi:type VI secretion system baseplate subunit TssG [Roseibium sp. M-1]